MTTNDLETSDLETSDLETMRLWFDLCHRSRVGLADATAMGERLQSRYNEPARHYHGLEHIADSLGLAEKLDMGDVDRIAVEFTLWFHDAVYDPRASDNEEQSAALAHTWLVEVGLASIADRIADLVRATQTHQPPDPEDRAACVVHDVDLAILAVPPADYARYAEQIRQEYAHVDDASFALGRSAALTALTDRDAIYATPELAAALTEQARTNVTAELSELSRGSGSSPQPNRRA